MVDLLHGPEISVSAPDRKKNRNQSEVEEFTVCLITRVTYAPGTGWLLLVLPQPPLHAPSPLLSLLVLRQGLSLGAPRDKCQTRFYAQLGAARRGTGAADTTDSSGG